jgi:hypothetical protein
MVEASRCEGQFSNVPSLIGLSGYRSMLRATLNWPDIYHVVCAHWIAPQSEQLRSFSRLVSCTRGQSSATNRKRRRNLSSSALLPLCQWQTIVNLFPNLAYANLSPLYLRRTRLQNSADYAYPTQTRSELDQERFAWRNPGHLILSTNHDGPLHGSGTSKRSSNLKLKLHSPTRLD